MTGSFQTKKVKLEPYEFVNLHISEQRQYLNQLKNDRRQDSVDAEIVDFFKKILHYNIPHETTKLAIEMLKDTGFKDKFLYRKYIYHIDKAVSETAKMALHYCSQKNESTEEKFLRILSEGSHEDRQIIVDEFLNSEGSIDENILISMLKFEDRNLRAHIIKQIDSRHKINDSKLARAVSQGNLWYVRSALITILAKRKSEKLFDIADEIFSDSNVDVRLNYIDALQRLNVKKCIPLLEKLAGDPLVWVRNRAKSVLKELKTKPT